MSTRIDPDFNKKLSAFGKADWNECFHCGNCTAICPLSETGFLFPRKGMRAVQMGLEEKLTSDVNPWLCYYCGECTDTCPRDANPAEMMMTLRRWLTSAYDWTGISSLFYRSFKSHLALIVLFMLAVMASFLVFADFNTPLSSEGIVEINSFAPIRLIEIIDLSMVGFLSFFLLSNIVNMYFKVVIRDKSVRVPIHLYFVKIWGGIFHFATQARFSKCEDKRMYWFMHWFLMSSYVIMFIFIVFFLSWFQTDIIYPWYHPQRLLGYYASAGIIIGSVYFVWNRIKRDKTIFIFSHHSDYLFPILLFLTALTGILVHIFRLSGLPTATYYMYMIHFMFLFPMVMLEVPFSKWAHLAYRPMAIYFANLKKAALQIQYNRKLAPAT